MARAGCLDSSGAIPIRILGKHLFHCDHHICKRQRGERMHAIKLRDIQGLVLALAATKKSVGGMLYDTHIWETTRQFHSSRACRSQQEIRRRDGYDTSI